MASKGERIFAWVGVTVAVLSACALTTAVIIQQKMTDDASASQQSTLACADNITEQKFPVPADYTTQQDLKATKATDLTDGSGKAAKAGDCLIVKYYGTIATTGVKFDENFTSTAGFAFKLGEGQVIKGWDTGMVGMKAGGERRLVIPAAEGYGAQGSGAIPPNSALVFDVRLLRIQ